MEIHFTGETMNILVALFFIVFSAAHFARIDCVPLLKSSCTKSFAQESGARQSRDAILAAFNKSKRKIKEKYGIRTELFVEIRSVPAIRKESKDYAGVYEVNAVGYVLNLQIGTNGEIEADGYEPAQMNVGVARRFTLKDAKIEDAMLTATKVYDDGSAEKFEGLFLNRTETSSRRTGVINTFGLGVIGQRVKIAGGLNLDKLFYQLKYWP